jgi:Fur family ferric uptake transcriptional regulator
MKREYFEKDEKLTEKKMRKSMAREAMLSILSRSKQPVSAYEILEVLAKRGKSFNKTTVYRELEILKRLGSVRELFLRNDVALYELSGEHHHHVLCTTCGNIRPIHLPEPKEWVAEKLVLEDGFLVTDHSLEFFGVCRKCQLVNQG